MFASIILVCDEISSVRFVGINFAFIFFSNLFIVSLRSVVRTLMFFWYKNFIAFRFKSLVASVISIFILIYCC